MAGQSAKDNAENLKKAAIAEAWRRGILSWKLDANQKLLHEMYYRNPARVQTWLLARRSGKSYCLCILALEHCLRKSNTIVKFLAPTKLQIDNILRPLLKEILDDCPEDVKPTLSSKDKVYYFKNGSEIQLAGSDGGHAEKLRGGSSVIAIVDESGDVDNLDYIVKSILLPTTLTTNGKVLLAGTPPKDPDHEFVKYIEECELRGTLIKKTIDDNPRLTKEQIASIEEELGGRNSEAFRREMLCQIIKDTTTAVLPEFDEATKAEIIKDWPRPPFFDAYVGMDLGALDLTFLVFGYYDFRAAKIVIEDELVLDFTKSEMNLKTLTELGTKKEEELWFNPLSGETKKPLLRTSDINHLVTREIAVYSGGKFSFVPTKKDLKEVGINQLRTLLSTKQIIINPRCKNLIRHLDNVKWASAKNKKDFGRSPDNGHYDGVDALIYFIRAINTNRNPYPANYNINVNNLFNPQTQSKLIDYTVKTNDLETTILRMMNVKRKQ